MKSLESRYYVFLGIFITIGVIFLIKLFSLQVIDDKYVKAAQGNFKQSKVEFPFRGLIYDRNGNLLVYNEPIFDLMIIPREVRIDTNAFCKMMNITKAEFYEKFNKCNKGLWRYKPSPFLKQISIEELASIEDKLINFSGFYPQVRTVRKYATDAASHVLGYVAEISSEELDRKKEDGYKSGDYIGKAGIESYYEPFLKGKRGKKVIIVNKHGVNQGSFKDGKDDIPAIPGKTLITTIDLQLQEYAEKLFKGKLGGAVAIEPKTGEILSMVSAPGYAPNLLTGRKFSENYAVLNQDTGKVFYNRAIKADQYPPGSTFKTAQSLVALQMGVITPESRFRCNRRIVNCHGPHTKEDLRGAITHSCNPYFWNVFKRMVNQKKSTSKFKDTEIGLREWKKFINSFGFGTVLKTDLEDVKPGNIPGVAYYDSLYSPGSWKHSTIRSLDIGQGEIGASPLQLANYTSILANRGYYITPHIVKSIGDSNYILPEFTKKHFAMIDSAHYTPVIEGMERVVKEGTGFRARLDSIIVCGKTGTSQILNKEDHSIFIAFAPKDDPKIAVAVYVEHSGQGARAAASIAGLMIEKYLNKEISKRRKHIEEYVYKNHFIY